MSCGPWLAYDAGYYDPRGSGADYTTLVCQKCDKEITFRTDFRDDYQVKLKKAKETISKGCDKPKVTLDYHKELLLRMFEK